MEYVTLGTSGLVSSVIGLGGGSSGRFGLAKGGTRADAVKLIRTALDLGITFFDGAGLCGGVDKLLAEGLGHSRKDVLLSTKIHLGLDPTPLTTFRIADRASSWLARRGGTVCSGAVVRKRVERTLKVLRTDTIDILYLHAVSPRQYARTAAEVVPELTKLKSEGKIRAIGISEGFVSDPTHAMLQAALVEPFVDSIMVGFNLANPSAAETVLPKAASAGVGVVGMFALRGLGVPVRKNDRPTSKDCDRSVGHDRIMAECGVSSLAELAYRYCRHQPGMDVVLTGTGNPDHLRQNVTAVLAPPLPAVVMDMLRSAVARSEPA